MLSFYATVSLGKKDFECQFFVKLVKPHFGPF